MADVVLDANVIVGFLDATDKLHARASSLIAKLEAQGHESVLLDVTVGEAVSVLCRRSLSGEREAGVDLSALLAQVRQWFRDGDITFVHAEAERLFEAILDVVANSAGKLNFVDALLVVLQRAGVIDDVASFDGGLDNAEGFRRIS